MVMYLFLPTCVCVFCVQCVAVTWLRAASSWGMATASARWTSRGFMARSATTAGNLWRGRWWRSWGRPTIPPASCALFASTFKLVKRVQRWVFFPQVGGYTCVSLCVSQTGLSCGGVCHLQWKRLPLSALYPTPVSNSQQPQLSQ